MHFWPYFGYAEICLIAWQIFFPNSKVLKNLYNERPARHNLAFPNCGQKCSFPVQQPFTFTKRLLPVCFGKVDNTAVFLPQWVPKVDFLLATSWVPSRWTLEKLVVVGRAPLLNNLGFSRKPENILAWKAIYLTFVTKRVIKATKYRKTSFQMKVTYLFESETFAKNITFLRNFAF